MRDLFKKFKAHKASGVVGCLFLTSIVLEVIKGNNIRNKFKFPFYALTFDLKNNKVDEWIREAEYEAVCEKIVSYTKSNGLGYFKNLKQIITRESENLRKSSLELIKKFPLMSDNALADSYDKYTARYAYYYGLGAVTFIYESIFSEWLARSLMRQHKNAAEIISGFLKNDYTSFMIKSEDLLKKIGAEKNRKKKETLISDYLKCFFYMKTNYSRAPILTPKSVEKEADKTKNRANNGNNSRKTIGASKIKLTSREKIMIDILKLTEAIRDQRKRTNLIGGYTMARFLDQAIKRKKVKRELAEKIFWFEFRDLMSDPDKILPILKKRDSATVLSDGVKEFYSEKVIIEGEKIVNHADEIFGTPALGGKIKGKAKIILGSKYFNKFKKGDILITEMTRPDFLPVMKLASAIITDEGGLTCHAAIVSRELGIPCIVGAKIATQVLKDGDFIEVDADRGIVKIIK